MIQTLLKIKRAVKKTLKIRTRPTDAPPDQRQARIVRTVLFGSGILIAGAFYPGLDGLRPSLTPRQGEIAREDFIAPTEIVIPKSAQDIEEERTIAENASPVALVYDSSVSRATVENLRRFSRTSAHLKDSLFAQGKSGADIFSSILSASFPFLSSVTLRATHQTAYLDSTTALIEEILLSEVYPLGIIQSRQPLAVYREKAAVIRHGVSERPARLRQIVDITGARAKFLSTLNRLAREREIDVESHYEIGRYFIVANVSVDTAETRRREEVAVGAISDIKDQVQVGDLVVREGQVVDERQALILSGYAEFQRRSSAEQGAMGAYRPLVARIALVGLIFALLYLYLRVFRNDIFSSPAKLLALFVALGLEIIIVHYLSQRWRLDLFVYPLALSPILVAILFDTRTGVAVTFFMALLLGALERFNFDMTILAAASGAIGAYAVSGVRHRSQLYKAMSYLAVVNVTLAVCLGSLKLSSGVSISDDIYFGLAGAALTPMLALGVLPFFESLFGFTTDITLLELSDLNRPLLKRLALEAPGTYHHSIVVGTLAEAAAKTINANSLLARVGAYYHDIGKIDIAEYFVENQSGLKSKHDSLTPTMSAIILTSHVRKGRQLGEDNDIPDDVLNFIEEHHGTMIMSYFYSKAIKQGATPDVEPEFHYPGPRPRTRETAIVMLADGVEAASRTLDDPTPSRVESLVQKIIDDRYHAGELSECPLTLSQLAKIRDAFVQILLGAFHQRVSYPGFSAGGAQ